MHGKATINYWDMTKLSLNGSGYTGDQKSRFHCMPFKCILLKPDS